MIPSSHIGRNLSVEGPDKLRGLIKYAGDMSLPGMLQVVPVLAPAPNAVITALDPSEARGAGALVLTAEDVQGSNRFGPVTRDQPVLVGAGEKARYLGDTVAIVAAPSVEEARAAARLVRVEFEELPPVETMRQALQPGAARVHEEREDNVCSRAELLLGEVEAAFREAEVVIEETIRTPRQEHGYLEPEAAVAYQDRGGRIVLQSCLQDPYYFGCDIAQALGIPASRLRVQATPLGGGFGGKDDITLQAQAVLVTLRTGRPARMVYSREESILVHPKRHPAEFRLRLGARADGALLALECDVWIDAGAYTGRSPVVATIALHSLSGPYFIPNLALRGTAVFTNNLISGACRGYGQPQSTAAREIILDTLAARIDVDPVELRRRNLLGRGQQAGTRLVNLDTETSVEEVMDRALDHAGPLQPTGRRRLKVGRGLACAMPLFDIGALPSLGLAGVSVTVEVLIDGSVMVRSAAVDMGQGVRDVLTLMAAEEFSVSPEKVTVLLGDTDCCPKSGPTTGSRQTYVSGNALLAAAGPLKERLLAEASAQLDRYPSELELAEGTIRTREAPHASVPLADVARQCYYKAVSLREESWFKAPQAMIGHTFVATVADVEVDEDTGEVRVTSLVTAHDIGRAINPAAVRGQLIGGAVQSLGWALTEDLSQAGCWVDTPSLSEYLLPTSLDVPQVKAVLVENAYPSGPFGAKGVGEHATVTSAPAILNAIRAATGAELNEFPATPERVLGAMGRVTAGEREL